MRWYGGQNVENYSRRETGDEVVRRTEHQVLVACCIQMCQLNSAEDTPHDRLSTYTHTHTHT